MIDGEMASIARTSTVRLYRIALIDPHWREIQWIAACVQETSDRFARLGPRVRASFLDFAVLRALDVA